MAQLLMVFTCGARYKTIPISVMNTGVLLCTCSITNWFWWMAVMPKINRVSDSQLWQVFTILHHEQKKTKTSPRFTWIGDAWLPVKTGWKRAQFTTSFTTLGSWMVRDRHSHGASLTTSNPLISQIIPSQPANVSAARPRQGLVVFHCGMHYCLAPYLHIRDTCRYVSNLDCVLYPSVFHTHMRT